MLMYVGINFTLFASIANDSKMSCWVDTLTVVRSFVPVEVLSHQVIVPLLRCTV